MAENHAPEVPTSPVARQYVDPPQNEKQKGLPSVTPMRFRKFFTPRQTFQMSSASSRALRDVTGTGRANHNHNHRLQTPSSPLKPPVPDFDDVEHMPTPRSRRLARLDPTNWTAKNPISDFFDPPSNDSTPRRNKRRKTGHDTPPDTSPLKPPSHNETSPSFRPTRKQPARPATLLSPMQSLAPSHMTATEDISDFECDDPDDYGPPKRLQPLTHRSNPLAAHLVQRQLGDTPRAGRHFLSCPASDWRSETADFASTPDDIHFCTSHEDAARCIPFCAAACHTNSLVAVGDEEGRVRLLDSASSARFEDIHVSFQAHSNAIIDLDFSENDYLLATASGDQTGKVIDMKTQTPVAVFGHHTASLKQIRFKPGEGGGNVLATSSRDGSVLIWDLRCGGKPVQEISLERESNLNFRHPPQLSTDRLRNSIKAAHLASAKRQTRSQAKATPHPDAPRPGEAPGRLGEVSVTALQYLPAGRGHLLLSACEADASIRVWDTRSIKAAGPISYTAPPASHTSWRPFGISSLSMSSDGARLYALCKDNTVYAYSTANLALGKANDLSTFRSGREPISGKELARRSKSEHDQEGPGPMYGFRHPNFHATSFYVKSAVRPARDGRSELLAVGSADGCAVLFPTDERLFKHEFESGRHHARNSGNGVTDASFTGSFGSMSGGTSRPGTSASRHGGPGLFRTNSSTNLAGRQADDIPIVKNIGGAGASWGTPLVRGHSREVGALTWTSEGKLVTVGDDYKVRCWSEEDRSKAADLRTGGETEGRRWACGWAEVGEDWDADEW